VSDWILNQPWGLPVLLLLFIVLFIFEGRKALWAYRDNKKTEFIWALFFSVVAFLALLVLLFY